MTSSNFYREYLASEAWSQKREAVIARCAGICEQCMMNRVQQIHHLTYERLGNERLEDLMGLCARCHMKIHGIDSGEDEPRIVSLDSMLRDSLLRATEDPESSSPLERIMTSTSSKIDALTGGIRPRSIWVLGAETSWGKSSFCLAIAEENMKFGAKTLIVSTEDSLDLYADRLLARRTGLPANKIRDRRLDREEMKFVSRVVESALPIPILMDGIGRPVEELAPMISAAVDQHGFNLVCVDYIQEVRSRAQYQDERIKFKEIASQLRRSIKQAGAAGILVSQITPREDKKIPDKDSIRESRDISNAADVVALGYFSERDDYEHGLCAGDRVLKIDKSKQGQRGAAGLPWDPVSANFMYDPEARAIGFGDYAYYDSI